MSPFRALYGQDPPSLFRFQEPLSVFDAVNTHIHTRNAVLDELKQNLARSQQIMKHYADQKRRDVTFEAGDQVYLKLQPYRHKSLARRPNEKLSPRFYGPFRVLEKIGTVAYRLQLPPEAHIHSVFHISQLKKSLSSVEHPHPLPPMLSADMELQVTPETVLKHRRMTDGRIELLIKWTSLTDLDNTWEDYDVIRRQFPFFRLEDKATLVAGGIDEYGPMFTYYRRKPNN